jgi:hypothetical protein
VRGHSAKRVVTTVSLNSGFGVRVNEGMNLYVFLKQLMS